MEASELRIDVVNLDHPEGKIVPRMNVDAASESHGKGIIGGAFDVDVRPAEEDVGKR